jgi:multisubunit Na+/H+ antiporter MnhB subunit
VTSRRALRLLGYGVAGLLVGGALAAGIMLAGAVAFWLLIFGDDPWPARAENTLVGVAYAAGLFAVLAALHLGWRRSRAP